MPDASKNRQILVVGIIVIIVLVGAAYFIAGARGVSGILNFVKWATIAVIIIGVAVWGAWFLFIRKVRDDRVALNVKQIVEQARLTKPDTLSELYISGDIDHPRIRLGRIIGYTRIKNINDEEEDVFVFQKAGFPFSLFEEPKALRCLPDTHSEMIGDIIVAGISLVQHAGFLYINTEHLNLERIDKTVKAEVMRKFTIDTLRDLKVISDICIGIDPAHSKMLEGKSLLKIPSRTEPVAPQQGTYENPRG
jgi:hypothetical protein